MRQKVMTLVMGERDVEPRDVTPMELSMLCLIYAKLTGFDQARMRRAYIKMSNNNPRAILLARAWYAGHITFSHLVDKICE